MSMFSSFMFWKEIVSSQSTAGILWNWQIHHGRMEVGIVVPHRVVHGDGIDLGIDWATVALDDRDA